MKKSKLISLICAIVLVLLVTVGCMNAAKQNSALYDSAPMMTRAFGLAKSDEREYADISAENYTSYAALSENDRQIIANAWLQMQTKEYDALNAAIRAKLTELKGYVESQSEENYDSGRWQTLVVRVPSDKLEAFLDGLDENATIISNNVSFTDVTDTMIETGSRRKALEAEEASLLEILKKADTVQDIITVQDRLSDVKAELESYILQLQRLENQVSYSTVSMDIREVERISAPSQSFITLAGTGFMESLNNLGLGLRNFVIFLISALPYLVLIGVIVIVPLAIIIKRRRRKNS